MTHTEITRNDNPLLVATDVETLPSYEEARDNRTGSISGNVARILAARSGVELL